MTALKIIGAVLLVLLLLSLLRLGVIVDFGGALRVRVRVGAIKVTVIPKRERKKKSKKADKKPKAPAAQRKKRALPKLTLTELRELATVALDALGRTMRRTCRRTRIDPLEVCVRFAGDPADAARSYGYASAVVWSVMPRLEELFYIPTPSITLRMDMEAERTRGEGTVGVTLRVCDLVAIAVTLALPLGRWLMRYKRAHANDPAPQAAATTGNAPAESAGENTDNAEQISAQKG